MISVDYFVCRPCMSSVKLPFHLVSNRFYEFFSCTRILQLATITQSKIPFLQVSLLDAPVLVPSCMPDEPFGVYSQGVNWV